MKQDNDKPFVPVRFAVLAVSDSRSLAEDRSGATLAERIEGAGHVLAGREITTDDKRKIRAVVRRWIADADIDVIITMPNVMAKVGRLGKVLGPRGLMPNPKTGKRSSHL